MDTNSMMFAKSASILMPSEYRRIFGICLVILCQYEYADRTLSIVPESFKGDGGG